MYLVQQHVVGLEIKIKANADTSGMDPDQNRDRLPGSPGGARDIQGETTVVKTRVI